MAKAIAKTAAIAVAAGLTFAGSAGIATDALAQNIVNGDAASTTSYSLTVTKRAGAPVEVPGYDGSALEKPPANAPDVLDGFKFKIEQVKPGADDINDAAKATLVDGGFTGEGTTGTDGTVKFSNLPAGVYRVTETEVPAESGYIAGPAFLVAVPRTTDDGTSTVNDVNVYPKNTKAGIEKTVQDKGKNSAQNYTYTIASDIPAHATGEKLVSYRVEDDLDSRLAEPKAEDIEVRLGEDVADWASISESLSQGEDYTVAFNPAARNVRVIFTDAGLTKLAAQESGTKVLTRITTTAPGLGEAETLEIPNTSKLIFNNGNGDGEIERESKEVETYWGTLNITKTDGTADGANGLAGAKFQIVQCQAGEGTNYAKIADTDPVTVAGETEWETDSDGKIVVKGIHATDFADNAPDSSLLCAQETKAPSGFRKDDRLIPFIISYDGNQGAPTQIPGAKGEAAKLKYDMTFANSTDNNVLPNTGGMGVLIIVLAGLAIIGGGVYAARRNSQAA
ncbi:SpaH/EbpB family LPXTG-anchored major pilin [Corynebacterium hadale]|uniref:SpaH/EbpB family LPXTG-anchored major pilin n=1 Tax=Corynebacterium hadale TaxID=2026255 RepID=UPI000BAA8051|nr:SpaH/EbpB family LPXTG-anchored major pilin [Corynebacterium hadale]PAT12703.1 hypothetical protein CKJ83_05325 [Corynebacterium hadale]